MLELAISAIILVVSLGILAKASHFTIKSTEDVMELTGLSEVSIGFAILALITCMPELTVAGFAVYEGVPGISIGDILGSHVFNIGVVLGILAVLGSLRKCHTEHIIEVVDLLFLASVIPLFLVILRVAAPVQGEGLLSYDFLFRLVGVMLLGVFAFSIYRIIRKKSPVTADQNGKTHNRKNRKTIIAKTLIGAALVVIASRFVVSSASGLAYLLGGPIAIGAKVVAIGTSLPELMFCLAAAKQRRIHLALGDAIGANLTTITLVLGIVLLTSPYAFNVTIFTELLFFVLVTNLILWRYLTRGGVSQIGGIVLILVYVLFQAIV